MLPEPQGLGFRQFNYINLQFLESQFRIIDTKFIRRLCKISDYVCTQRHSKNKNHSIATLFEDFFWARQKTGKITVLQSLLYLYAKSFLS